MRLQKSEDDNGSRFIVLNHNDYILISIDFNRKNQELYIHAEPIGKIDSTKVFINPCFSRHIFKFTDIGNEYILEVQYHQKDRIVVILSSDDANIEISEEYII